MENQVQARTYQFYTEHGYRIFGGDTTRFEQDHTLTNFASRLRYLEHRVRIGDVFADKLWHDIFYSVRDIAIHIQDNHAEKRHIFESHNMKLGPHPKNNPVVSAAFKSYLSDAMTHQVVLFDEYVEMVLQLIDVGIFFPDELYQHLARCRTKLIKIFKMPLRLSRDVHYTRLDEYRNKVEALEIAKEAMPKIRPHTTMLKLERRISHAPQIYNDCIEPQELVDKAG